MTISIVIPVYNVQDYIKKCLDSILSQTFSDLEIILVDDGSTDLSGRICDYYSENDKRIKVIHTANGGQSEARNVGIKNATSEWITFIDSDDYVSSDYIEYLYNLIQVHNADISIASFDNTYVSEITIPNLTTIGYDYKKFGETLIDVSIKAIKKIKIDRINLMDSKILIRDSCKEFNIR